MLNGKGLKKYDYCGACTFYLGAVIVTLVCQALAGVISASLAGAHPDIAQNGDFNTAFMIFIQIANAAFIIVYSKINRYGLNFTVFKHRDTGKNPNALTFVVPVVAAALLMIGMYLPTVWYGYFTTYALRLSPEVGNISLDTPSSVAMIVIGSVLCAPVCEEAIYRGVLFGGLRERYTTVKAVLFSALAFMLMHMSPVQVVFQLALGVLSAFIMVRSGRLISSVMLHASANALALVMQLTPLDKALSGCVVWLTDNVAAAFFITLGLFVACGAALFFLVRFGFGKSGKKNDGQTISDGGQSKNAAETVRDEITSAERKKDGTIRYWIAIGICGLMFVLNLIAGVTM